MKQPRKLSANEVPSQFRSYAELALASDWTITTAGDGHIKWKSPPGWPLGPVMVTTGKTINGHRAENNAKAKLRRAGLRP